MNKKVPFRQITDRIAAENPEFGEALDQERAAYQICAAVRDQLRQLRKTLDVTQAQMAERLDMSQSAVSKIENGAGDIGLASLARYAQALGAWPAVSFQVADAVPVIEHGQDDTAVGLVKAATAALLAAEKDSERLFKQASAWHVDQAQKSVRSRDEVRHDDIPVAAVGVHYVTDETPDVASPAILSEKISRIDAHLEEFRAAMEIQLERIRVKVGDHVQSSPETKGASQTRAHRAVIKKNNLPI